MVLANLVGAGDKGWRKNVSSAAPLGAPWHEDGGGNGAQFKHADPGIAWVPNSSNSINGSVKGVAPNSGLAGKPVGISRAAT
mgnify:CR=1 FL=1